MVDLLALRAAVDTPARLFFAQIVDKVGNTMDTRKKPDRDLEQALQDPAGTFGSPEALLRDHRLTIDQKRSILQQWQQDAKQLEEAAAENMAGGEPNMLHRVSEALVRLES